MTTNTTTTTKKPTALAVQKAMTTAALTDYIGAVRKLDTAHDAFAHANGHAGEAEFYLSTATSLLAEGLESDQPMVIIMAALAVLEHVERELDTVASITAEGVREAE